MRFCSIGSGSKGNGTLIQKGATCLLIDSGFTVKDVEFRLAQKGLTPLDLTAILVTHEHSDHIKGVGPLARKYRIPVYMSHGTAQYEALGKIPVLKYIDPHQDFEIGSLLITPVVVPHDAREPTQFVVTDHVSKLGVLTDLGCITPHIINVFNGCSGLLLETNHDVSRLRAGPYPPKLKRRVEGSLGHLSNWQAADLLRQLDVSQLQYLIATHISEQNNSLDLVLEALNSATGRTADEIIIAEQSTGFEWCAFAEQTALAPA